MSARLGAVDLHALIRSPTPIDPLPPVGSEWHALGPGFTKKISYATVGRQSNIRLPSSGPGLERLRAQTLEPIELLPEEYWSNAWAGLYSRPGLVASTTLQSLDHEGLLVVDGVEEQLRELTLVSVFSVGESPRRNALPVPRVASVTQLVLLPPLVKGEGTRDAWSTTQWLGSTRQLQSALEPIRGLTTTALAGARGRIDIVVAEEDWRLDGSVVSRLKRLSEIAGFRPAMHAISGENFDRVWESVTGEKASLLVLVGEGLDQIAKDFAEDVGIQRLVRVSHGTSTEAIEVLRERLAAFAGVGNSFSLQAPPSLEREPDDPNRPPWPLRSVSRCLHVRGRPYLLDEATGWWWTRDTARHAKVAFKTYTLENRTLVWHGDWGADGTQAVNKWKGEDGRTLPDKPKSCANPSSHLKN